MEVKAVGFLELLLYLHVCGLTQVPFAAKSESQ